MKKADWLVILITVAIVALGMGPAIAANYKFRPGAGNEITVLMFLGALVLGLWYYLTRYTYDIPKFRRRKHDWEDSDES